MDWDPHTIHLILQRIRQQMRCPQCGEKVCVDMPSVRMTGEDFMLLQLRCDVCDAYVVLHAGLQGYLQNQAEVEKEGKPGLNMSTCLCSKDEDIDVLRETLQKSGGSFGGLFEEKASETKE